MKSIILWSAGVVILVGVVALLSTGKTGESEKNTTIIPSNGILTMVETDYDFGTIKMGDGDVSKTYEIINNSEEAVTIGRVYTSCACTTAYVTDPQDKRIGKFGMPGHDGMRNLAGIEVSPGESVTLEAIYDPAYHGPAGVGLAQRTIYIETNSLDSPKMELSLQATVIR